MEYEAPRCGNWLLAAFFWGALFAWWAYRLLCKAIGFLWSHYVRPRQIWGRELPQTIEAIVEDFLLNRLSPETHAWLREQKTPPKWSPQAITLRNELRERYGLETWNRRLLRDIGCPTVDGATQLLLKGLWERVK